MEIPHLAGIAAIQPFTQKPELGERCRRSNSAEIEPDGCRLAFDLDR
jgi:hypothetical protein